ncbi:OmpA family protein [Marinifilum sp.]|uniref:OmpA family protein n=1 Tax=Marinifilum sp. TaxID=2033137 RepID=UPI003BA9B985
MKSKAITNILLAFFLIIVGNITLSAQSQLVQKGNRHFNNNEFANAINYFQKFLEGNNDIETERKLAKCYVQIHKDSEALHIMEKLVSDLRANSKDFLNYAYLLKRMRKYDEAKHWFKKYAKIKPRDQKIKNLILSCNLINELEDKEQFIVNPISINSTQSDFASALYKDGLVFVSGRYNKTSKQIDGRTGEHYLDLYYAERVRDRFLEAIPFSNIFNTKYHEGPACFTPNEHFIFFTRNKGNLNLEGKSELNIFTSRFNGKSWDKPELFLFSGRAYSVGHPSISPDGRSLYFISNMKGGYGGTDIYLCRKLGFSWSKPINLGPTVNTSGNEMFPFIGHDNYLYFASDGHIGFGGLDIFKTTFAQNHWTFPVNLGPPFNSEKDDFALIFKGSKEEGYFSSNRSGNDDIFFFKQNPEKVKSLHGRVVDLKSKQSISDVEIVLMDKLSKEKVTKSSEKGMFKLDVLEGENYSLIVSKPGYKSKRILYFNQKGSIPKQLNISMETTPWVKFKGVVMDQYSGRALEHATIELISRSYKTDSYCETNDYGEFVHDIDPSQSYDIIIRQDAYFTKVISNYRYQGDQFEQIELQKFNKNDNMQLFGVEYKKNSVELSDNTITELDNLANLLLVNPNIAIQIIGFTNFDNGRKDNKILSLERASRAAEYVISKGITSNRVEYKSGGYDAGKPALTVKLLEAF